MISIGFSRLQRNNFIISKIKNNSSNRKEEKKEKGKREKRVERN
jgi:hypothetical protein